MRRNSGTFAMKTDMCLTGASTFILVIGCKFQIRKTPQAKFVCTNLLNWFEMCIVSIRDSLT